MTIRSVGVLLAAGAGRRFDPTRPGAKLEAPFENETVGVRSLSTLMSAVDATLVVVRSEQTALAREAHQRGARVVIPTDFDLGMGHSIAAAATLAMVAFSRADVLVLALADMPWTRARTIVDLVEQCDADRIVRPRFEAALGHPVAFGRKFWVALTQCRGDEGARNVLAAHESRVTVVDVADSGVTRDVDEPTDLTRFSV